MRRRAKNFRKNATCHRVPRLASGRTPRCRTLPGEALRSLEFWRMEPRTDQQGLPLGADHFVLLMAPTYSLNEIVERPALALSFPHDELGRV
jgi:hypothetical protein